MPIDQVTLIERNLISQARSAYASCQASFQVILSSRVGIDASRLSLEGVRAENGVGSRTIIDVLNAEQEFLNAQTNLTLNGGGSFADPAHGGVAGTIPLPILTKFVTRLGHTD